MTSKGFLGCQKTGGKRSDGKWSDNLLCFLRFGSGAIYRCEGWHFWGEGSEVWYQGIYSFPTGRQGWTMRMWHHLICGSKICCGFSWIYWSTVYSGIYCGFSRLNSPVWGFIRWTTENSGPCFQPKRQKRPQNPGNHHLGWVSNMGQWTRQNINWLARFCQQFPRFQVKEFCWGIMVPCRVILPKNADFWLQGFIIFRTTWISTLRGSLCIVKTNPPNLIYLWFSGTRPKTKRARSVVEPIIFGWLPCSIFQQETRSYVIWSSYIYNMVLSWIFRLCGQEHLSRLRDRSTSIHRIILDT